MENNNSIEQPLMTKIFEVPLIIKYHNSYEDFLNNNQELENIINILWKKSDNICPSIDNIFRFMNRNIDNIKVIILGMDPYPQTYMCDGKEVPVATGRAFEVANVEKWTDSYRQKSLAMIFKALWNYKYDEILSMEEIRKKTLENDRQIQLNVKKWYDKMEEQGVVFLNAYLSVEKGQPLSHKAMWDGFTTKLMKYINEKNNRIKWFIWGREALNKVEGIVNKDNIVYNCHPATRTCNDFVENSCFKKVQEINWL